MVRPDVLVLPPGDHGHSSRNYAETIGQHLPEHTVRHADSPREERELISSAPVATGTTLDAELLGHADDLELFACTWAGYDHLPLEELAERSVAVTNASGVFAPNIAEHVVGGILVFVRRFHEGWRRNANHEWRHYQARELAGSTVTIVGLGSIGRAVGRRLEPFDVERIGVRHTPSKGGPVDEVIGYDDAIHRALARTDYLVLTCPLTATTRGLIGGDELDRLPSHAVLVNVARGEVVETPALVRAVEGQSIRGAALDVTDPEPLPQDHPLWTFDNVHITPHNAGSSPHIHDRLAEILAENVRTAERTGSYADLRNQILP
jgi:phosphoglycerate dehydrogenase-like enzyme